MPALSLLNFQAIVSQSAAAVQSSCSKLLNLTVGSVLRSILEASASVGIWTEYQIVLVLQGIRLATSIGTDVDSFVNQFTMQRLGAVASSGLVTFARSGASIQAQITPYFNADGSINTSGITVVTADFSNTFGVTVDTTNPAWNAGLSGYVIPVGAASANIPVKNLSIGSAGNIQEGTIQLVSAGLPYVDTATNAAPFQNGLDPESDPAVKTRFQNFINTRSLATPAAVAYAIATTQPGITYEVLENTNAAGTYQPGNFVIYIDDGTGDPPSTLIAAVQASVDAVRPIGSTFSVFGPTVIDVTVSLAITVGPSGVKSTAQGEVQAAILDYIDTLPVGGTLPYSKLAQLAWASDPNITNVSTILLNGGTADVTATAGQVIKATQVAVN